MVRRSVADDSYGRVPFAWAIELCEVHALPCAQCDRTVADREGHAVADEDRFDVCGAVSFRVFVLRIARDRSLERCEEVPLHIGIRVLVHEDRRGRVLDGDRFVASRHALATRVASRPGAPAPWAPTPGPSASRSAAIRAMSDAVALPPL